MNQITKRNRLTELLTIYASYLPICPDENCQAMIDEMVRLKTEISRIKKMGLQDLQLQVEEYTVTLQSKLNYMEDLEPYELKL